MPRKAEDLIGQKFGQLTVLERDKSRRTGTYWRCVCDCGNTSSVEAAKLKRKLLPTRSCGCLVAKTVDRVGQRFGRLVVVAKHGYKHIDSRKDVLWKCRCDCGNIVIVHGSNLASRNSGSCGCYRRSSLEAAGLRFIYNSYRKHATEYGRIFTLSHRRFYKLIKQKCTYCGDVNTNSIAIKGQQERFLYNGIDRVDSSGGYTVKNSTPCCRKCNFMKGTLSTNDFINHIQAIYDHLDLRFFE